MNLKFHIIILFKYSKHIVNVCVEILHNHYKPKHIIIVTMSHEKSMKQKKPTCLDILKGISTISHSDIEVYQTLKNKGNCDVEQVAKQLKKERSTIYRSLQRLTKSGFCIRNIKTMEKGGYYYEYSCSNLIKLKKQMRTCSDEWYNYLKTTLNTDSHH